MLDELVHSVFDGYMTAILVLVFAVTLLDIYLTVRQYRHTVLNRGVIPKELAEVKDIDVTASKAAAYSESKLLFTLFKTLFTLVWDLLFIPRISMVWDFTVSTLVSMDMDTTGEIVPGLFFALVLVVITTVRDIPFDLYSTFVIEEQHGFNKSTIGTFIKDKIIGFLLTCGIGGGVLALLIAIIQWGGDLFYIYAWSMCTTVIVVIMFVFPTYIAPLFNTITPLEDGDLKDRLLDLAKKEKFPLNGIYVCDGSKRSKKANAYFAGLFNSKRCVLYDTLVENVSVDELTAVVGHEIGHWSHGHLYFNIMLSSLQLLVFFMTFSTLQSSKSLGVDFFFESRLPIMVSLMLFSILFSPLSIIISLVFNFVSRKFEFQADRYAAERDLPLGAALIKLHTDNLGSLCDDPLYSVFEHSHPTVVERLRAMNALKKKEE